MAVNTKETEGRIIGLIIIPYFNAHAIPDQNSLQYSIAGQKNACSFLVSSFVTPFSAVVGLFPNTSFFLPVAARLNATDKCAVKESSLTFQHC